MVMSLQIHRLGRLPETLGVRRYASHATIDGCQSNGPSGSFPFPTHPRPTPHQIFHLPPGASQKEIKTRYYDLVRSHHPDSHNCRTLTPEERHSRFRAITSAYDILRGKSSGSLYPCADPWQEEILRRKQFHQAYHARRRAGQADHEFLHPHRESWAASPDDRWKDRIIIIVGLVSLVVGVAPGLFVMPRQLEKQHQAAVDNLRQARSEARELGTERRDGVRKRVKELESQNFGK